MKKLILGLIVLASPSYGALISHTDYSAGNTITSSLQNTNENVIVNEFNGHIDDVNISAGANIAVSKIVALTASSLVTTDSGGHLTATGGTLNGNLVVSGSVTVQNVVFDNTSNHGIVGATNGGSGAVGNVGEIIQATFTATNFPTSTHWTAVSTITLTAGDWMVSAVMFAENNGATWSSAQMELSATSGDNTTGSDIGNNLVASTFGTTSSVVTQQTMDVPDYHVLVSGSTPLYMKFMSIYSVGNPRAYGRITATRIR